MRTSHRRRIRSAATMVGCCVLAAMVAVGCGSDDRDDDGPSSRRSTGPVEVQDVTPPEPSEDLAEELGEAGEALTGAGCTFGTYDEGEPTHVEVGEELDDGDFPPTSGVHYEDWAPFGIYSEPVDDGFVVHNLEHGGVVVWLGTKVDTAIADTLDEEHVDDGEKWIVAPRKDIEGLFSGAWARGLSCPPAAVEQLGVEATADALDAWYEAVESTGSEAEKDVPAYAGAMKEPTPDRDISTESPF